MKKVFMSLLLAAGVYGIVVGQASQSQSSHSQTSTSSSMQSDKDAGWEKIGEKTIDFSKNRDELTLNTMDGKFSAIKFKAKEGTVNLSNVELQYAGGTKQTLSLESPIRAEGESKVLSLNSSDKKLEKITFDYKKESGAGQAAANKSEKAKVEVWGMKAGMGSGSGMGSSSRSGQSSGSGINSKSSSDTSMYHSTTPATTPGSSSGTQSGTYGTQSGTQSGSQSSQGSTVTSPGSSTTPNSTPGSGSSETGTSTTPAGTSTTPGSSSTTR